MSWRRRKKIREQFEECFRYHIPPTGPKTPPPPPTPPPPAPPTPPPKPPESRTGGVVVVVEFRDGAGHVFRIPLQFDPRYEGGREGGVHDSNEHPIDPQELAGLLQDGEVARSQPQAQAQDAHQPVWIRIPQGEKGQVVLENIVRMLGYSGSGFPDGLRALLGLPAFQQLFQGDKISQGATQLLPNSQLIRLLLPPSALSGNPEAMKSLLIAEGLPPELIHSIPDKALAGALQSLLQTGALVGENPLHFLQSVSSVLTLAGVPVQQVQSLLLTLAKEAQQAGIHGGISQGALEQLAARMTAINNPQLLGLNQLVQESFGKGITQILNSFIRVFMGGALMQSQSAWPQAVPNERMLAELGGLFAMQNKKEAEDRGKKKRAKKKESKVQDVDLDLHPRVERKDVVQEEPQQPQMESIFISLDSEE